jgi:hypothetical protein
MVLSLGVSAVVSKQHEVVVWLSYMTLGRRLERIRRCWLSVPLGYGMRSSRNAVKLVHFRLLQHHDGVRFHYDRGQASSTTCPGHNHYMCYSSSYLWAMYSGNI